MVEINSWNIIPIVLFIIFLVTIVLSYSIINLKHSNAEHSETKWILHKTFTRTIDHDENVQNNLVHCFDKSTDDLKQIVFTEAHEHELHDMELRVKKIEDTLIDMNKKFDDFMKNQSKI